jgi:CRP-like cAMP-binding protein
MPPLNAKEAENPPDATPCRPPCSDKDMHALLLQLPLFRSLNGKQLNLIAQACHLIPIARHDFVFRKGDPANGLYIVASGSVKLSLRAASGKEKIIDFFREGDTFGEALMFLEMPYVSQAQALKDTLLIWIKKEDIDQALEHIPSFARHLLVSLSLRLHTLMRDIKTTHLQSAMQRVLSYLLNLPRTGDVVQLPFHKKNDRLEDWINA